MSRKGERIRNNFSKAELELIDLFLKGETIRSLSSKTITVGGESISYGRTAIKNLLDDYICCYPEYKDDIEDRLFQNKNHKTGKKVKLREITDSEIDTFYTQIIDGKKTITQLSLELGRTRDYIKRKIKERLNDGEKYKEFLAKLKENQNSNEDELYEEYKQLSINEKKDIIFEKINNKRKKSGRKPYSADMLERKLKRIQEYFLVTRNNKIGSMGILLSEEEFWKIVYNTPELLSYSLNDKVIPALENLDQNIDIGPEFATQIIVEDASILGSSIPRTNLQIKILVDNNLLDVFLKKPRYFRTSPELIYSLIQFSQGKQIKSDEDIFLTESRLKQRYGVSQEELIEKYKAQDVYGQEEYFDK